MTGIYGGRRRAALAAGDLPRAPRAGARARQRDPRAGRDAGSGRRPPAVRLPALRDGHARRTLWPTASADDDPHGRRRRSSRAGDADGYVVELDDGAALEADGVVLAVPAFAAAAAPRRRSTPSSPQLHARDPVRVVGDRDAGVPRARTSRPLDGYGYVVPRVEAIGRTRLHVDVEQVGGARAGGHGADPRLRRPLRRARRHHGCPTTSCWRSRGTRSRCSGSIGAARASRVSTAGRVDAAVRPRPPGAARADRGGARGASRPRRRRRRVPRRRHPRLHPLRGERRRSRSPAPSPPVAAMTRPRPVGEALRRGRAAHAGRASARPCARSGPSAARRSSSSAARARTSSTSTATGTSTTSCPGGR